MYNAYEVYLLYEDSMFQFSTFFQGFMMKLLLNYTDERTDTHTHSVYIEHYTPLTLYN